MPKRRIAGLLLGALIALAVSAIVHAAEPDPADEVKAYLTGKGYTVREVDRVSDEKGQPRPDAVYVLMDAVTPDLDHANLVAQVVWGLTGLYQYYPRATALNVVLSYRQYWIFFASNRADTAKYLSQAVTPAAFWAPVRGRVRIYDGIRGAYVDEKTFTSSNQSSKDQTGKDFTGKPDNPLPTPIPGNTKGGALWLEPSTTFLPTNGQTKAVMMATLLDENYRPVFRRRLTFTSQAPGKDEQTVGYGSTDTNGRAFSSFVSTAGDTSLLLRAAVDELNSQVPIVLGPEPKKKADQERTVKTALEKQGYASVGVDYSSSTRATGEVDNTAYVEMRIAANSFDRSVFSQMSRAFGTLRTVFPDATQLMVALIYRKDGRDWQLLWSVQTAWWDQYVGAKITENDFWRYLRYLGAYDEDGHSIDDKNFVDKNFGAGSGGKEARVTRTLESTVTSESWGEQWRGQEFVVLPGSFADGFAVAEWTGSATAFQIFQAPDFVTPVVTFKREDRPDSLAQVRLGQGQYLFSAVAPSAPTAVRVTYIEHLPQ